MRHLAVVLIVSAVFGSTAAVSVKQQRRWTEKLDVALMHAAEHGSADPVRTLIWVRAGTTDHVLSHLAEHGLKPTRSTTPGAIAVQLPGSMLRRIAGDRDVVHVSRELTPASAD
jgi:hypothetical protein